MGILGGAVDSFVASMIDKIMKAIWAAALWLLRTAFELVDSLLRFGDGSGVATPQGKIPTDSPLFGIWPTLRWISLVVALGLFFWQLTTTVLRGGHGFWRAVSGPLAYALATAITIGAVATLLGAAEGLTTLLLNEGLKADSFRSVLGSQKLGGSFVDNPDLGATVDETARSVVLGLVALFGVIPAALGFLLQMVFRQAVIFVLIATVPICAAGLMTNTTAVWFWKCLRWIMAAVLMKPALALVLVIGVNMLAAPTGLGGLMVGTGVLLVALFCPMALYRLLAFVEPGTASGATARSALSLSSSGRGSGAGAGGSSGGGAEETNTARFDAASGGGGGAGGSAAGSSGAAGGGAAAGGALAGGVAAVGAAVGAAASFSSGYANSQMDASGIGAGYGGGGRSSGSSGSGRSASPGGGSGGGDGGAAALPGGSEQSPLGGGDGGGGSGSPAPETSEPGPAAGGAAGGGYGETPPPDQPYSHDGGNSPSRGNSGGSGGPGGGAGAAGGTSEAVIP
ncbi:MAG: hypothetical protein QOC85_2240 [Streptomyces sp.]|nr:hypothetical protein [Streptomyces sp.]